MVFWQSPRTRKQARPDVRLPTARAAGVVELEIVVDAHERYPYKSAGQQVTTVRRGLACGDYAVTLDGTTVAAVERKSLTDLVSSLTSGRLRFALGELATLPRAAVVVEDRYSQVFTLERVRPATVADGLAELQKGACRVVAPDAFLGLGPRRGGQARRVSVRRSRGWGGRRNDPVADAGWCDPADPAHLPLRAARWIRDVPDRDQ